MLRRDPEQAAVALTAVENNARSAVDELHQTLRALRHPEPANEAAPAPSEAASTRGVGQIPELVDASERAGVPTTYTITGRPRQLQPAAELTLYRLAQEPLANVRKHAGAGRPGGGPARLHAGGGRDRRDQLRSDWQGCGGLRTRPTRHAGTGRRARRRVRGEAAARRLPGAGDTAATNPDPGRNAPSPVRVLLADDQDLVRGGLRVILESEPGLKVVGEAADGQAAVEQTLALAPDVVCMDVQMPVLDGLQAIRELVARGSRAHILVLTTFDRDDYLFEALAAGASGFLLKTASPEQLIEAVQVLARGDALLALDVTGSSNLSGVPEV